MPHPRGICVSLVRRRRRKTDRGSSCHENSKLGEMGNFPTGIGSSLPKFFVPGHLLSRSLHGQEESGNPQPIPPGDSSPHLPEGPETAAES